MLRNLLVDMKDTKDTDFLLSSDVWWMYRIYRFLVCFVVSLNR